MVKVVGQFPGGGDVAGCEVAGACPVLPREGVDEAG